jgi:hypothetical protein
MDDCSRAWAVAASSARIAVQRISWRGIRVADRRPVGRPPHAAQAATVPIRSVAQAGTQTQIYRCLSPFAHQAVKSSWVKSPADWIGLEHSLKKLGAGASPRAVFGNPDHGGLA